MTKKRYSHGMHAIISNWVRYEQPYNIGAPSQPRCISIESKYIAEGVLSKEHDDTLPINVPEAEQVRAIYHKQEESVRQSVQALYLRRIHGGALEAAKAVGRSKTALLRDVDTFKSHVGRELGVPY